MLDSDTEGEVCGYLFTQIGDKKWELGGLQRPTIIHIP